MGVKEELLEALKEQAWRNPLFSEEKAGTWLDGVLARYAHDLAEAIRAKRLDGKDIVELYGWAEGMEDAADLIDPEA